MKRNSYVVIIAIVAATAAIVIGISVVYLGFGKEPFIKITINGFEEKYNVKEPITFSATIEGYGNPCGEIEAWIYGIDRNFTAGPWAELPNCPSNQPDVSFAHKFPFDADSISTSVNQTGRYKLVVSFEQLPSHEKTVVQQEFSIVE